MCTILYIGGICTPVPSKIPPNLCFLKHGSHSICQVSHICRLRGNSTGAHTLQLPCATFSRCVVVVKLAESLPDGSSGRGSMAHGAMSGLFFCCIRRLFFGKEGRGLREQSSPIRSRYSSFGATHVLYTRRCVVIVWAKVVEIDRSFHSLIPCEMLKLRLFLMQDSQKILDALSNLKVQIMRPFQYSQKNTSVGNIERNEVLIQDWRIIAVSMRPQSAKFRC